MLLSFRFFPILSCSKLNIQNYSALNISVDSKYKICWPIFFWKELWLLELLNRFFLSKKLQLYANDCTLKTVYVCLCIQMTKALEKIMEKQWMGNLCMWQFSVKSSKIEFGFVNLCFLSLSLSLHIFIFLSFDRLLMGSPIFFPSLISLNKSNFVFMNFQWDLMDVSFDSEMEIQNVRKRVR